MFYNNFVQASRLLISCTLQCFNTAIYCGAPCECFAIEMKLVTVIFVVFSKLFYFIYY